MLVHFSENVCIWIYWHISGIILSDLLQFINSTYRCSRFFDDGKWAERTENSNSAEKVDFLLAEISGLSIEEIRAGDLFEALVCAYFKYSA